MKSPTASPANPDQTASWFDLSVVSDPLVAEALTVLLADWRMRKRWDELPAAHRRLHRAILRGYLQTGRAPLRHQLAGALGQAVGPGLDDLVARDLILLDEAEIAGAYPFTSRPARHSVEIAGREISAMCAIDALGAGAMARRNARVRARCAHCDLPIRVDILGQGLALDMVSPETAMVWAGVAPVSGCAADTQCQSLLLFCDDNHLADWRDTNAPDGKGYCLTPAQALQLGAAIFRPFLARSDMEIGEV